MLSFFLFRTDEEEYHRCVLLFGKDLSRRLEPKHVVPTRCSLFLCLSLSLPPPSLIFFSKRDTFFSGLAAGRFTHWNAEPLEECCRCFGRVVCVKWRYFGHTITRGERRGQACDPVSSRSCDHCTHRNTCGCFIHADPGTSRNKTRLLLPESD